MTSRSMISTTGLLLLCGALRAQELQVSPPQTLLSDAKEQLHFPFLYQSKQGNWYLTYRRGPHASKGGDRVTYAMSSDRGRTWQPWAGFPLEQPKLQPAPGSGDSRVRFFRLERSDGSLLSHRYILENPRPSRSSAAGTTWDGYLLTSQDDGAKWELQTAKVSGLPFDKQCGFWGHPVELPDGTLLLGIYGKSHVKDKFFNGLVASSDGGDSWQFLSTIGEDLGSEGPNELDLAVLASGDLLAVFRTGGAQAGKGSTPIYFSLSTDQGRHWSDPQPLPNSDGGVSPQLARLGKFAVLVYGLERKRIVAQLTTDGKTWAPPQLVYAGPGATYVDVQPLDENRLQIVFEESKFLSGPQPIVNRLLRTELMLMNSHSPR